MMELNAADARRVYAALQDDESRMIFKQRLLYSLTGDERHLADMLIELCRGESYDTVPIPDTKFCVYGAGFTAMPFRLMSKITGVKPDYYIDRYKTGSVDGVPIISPDEFSAIEGYRSYRVYLAVGDRYMEEVRNDLFRRGIEDLEPIIEISTRSLGGRQYFDLPELDLPPDGVFVDGGSYDGADTVTFLAHCPRGTVYAFEPNPKQYESCRSALSGYEHVSVLPYGLYSKASRLSFHQGDAPSYTGAVAPDGEIEIEAAALDELLPDQPVSFIKMDIEGIEPAALQGCERIIRTYKPKLAICIYHSPEDILDIPRLILSFRGDYRFYIRHYNAFSPSETVLYAI